MHKMVSLLVLLLCVGAMAAPQKVLFILLDGFRWDYAHKANLTTFHQLQGTGARAGYVISDFPSLSYPNYYTLMTGLHTESHGMTGNFMYAPDKKDYFLMAKNPEYRHEHWWNGGEPLWVTAVKKGKKAYMYHWPGCEVTIRGITPTFCKKNTRVTTRDDFRAALTAATAQLTDGGKADLAAVYHEEPDHVGHKHGPDSPQIVETLKGIDDELGSLFTKLRSINAKYQVNVIIMSDHGMTSISPNKIINITEVLTDPSLYDTIMEAGSIVGIYTKKGKIDQVYHLLKGFSHNMRVYKREEIPDRYHYKRGKYVADITCVATPGWTILQPLAPGFLQVEGHNMHGYHGYDNLEKDMNGIFYAWGPYFKPKSEVIYINAVDPYNIMCDILGIIPVPNNGSRSQMHGFLASRGHCLTAYTLFAVLASGSSSVITFMLM